jgi:flagellar motor switch protein FliG
MSEEAVETAVQVDETIEDLNIPVKPKGPVDTVRQAAIIVMILGTDTARKIFHHLKPRDIETLLTRAETLGDIEADEIVETLETLIEEVHRTSLGITADGRVLHRIAADALGTDRVAAILGTDSGGATQQLQKAAAADPAAFSKLLMREHPQVNAVVLSLLEPEVGAGVMALMHPEARTDVVARIATLRSVPAHVIAEIAETVNRELQPTDTTTPVQVDGTNCAVEILKKIGTEAEVQIFESLAAVDGELAEDLRSRMFVFEDILRLHAREIQMVLREVDGQKLSIALKRASGELKAYILSNMSSRAAQIILDDMEASGPVSLAQVEGAQGEMIETILRLAEEGSVNLRPGDTL